MMQEKTKDEMLIRSVKNYRFLYDLSHPYYTAIESKDKAWKEISEYLKLSAPLCKHRWQKLRDSYRRALNKRRLKGKKLKKWTYEEEMSFLEPYLILRSGEPTNDEFGLLDSNPSSQTIDVEAALGSDCLPQADWELEKMKPGDEEDAKASQSVAETPSEATPSAVWNDLSDYSNVNAEDCVSDASSTKTVTRKQKRVKNSEAQLLNSAALLAQLLKNNDDSGTQDELDNFFKNMASTVKKFSPYSQAMTKNKIFTLVSRCELEHLASLT